MSDYYTTGCLHYDGGKVTQQWKRFDGGPEEWREIPWPPVRDEDVIADLRARCARLEGRNSDLEGALGRIVALSPDQRGGGGRMRRLTIPLVAQMDSDVAKAVRELLHLLYLARHLRVRGREQCGDGGAFADDRAPGRTPVLTDTVFGVRLGVHWWGNLAPQGIRTRKPLKHA